MDYSIVIIDSVEKFNQYRTDFLKLDAEYHFWNLSTSKEFYPSYVTDFKDSFGDDLDTVLKELRNTKETGKVTKKLDEIYTSSYERGFVTLVLKNGTDFIGQMGLSSKESGVGVLIAVYLKPSYRGYNYATDLLEKIKNIAKEKGLTTIKLVTFPFMKRAIKFYLKNGFQYCDYFSEIEHPRENVEKFNGIYLELKL